MTSTSSTYSKSNKSNISYKSNSSSSNFEIEYPTEVRNLRTTETNMNFEMFANPDKLLKDIKLYKKEKKDSPIKYNDNQSNNSIKSIKSNSSITSSTKSISSTKSSKSGITFNRNSKDYEIDEKKRKLEESKSEWRDKMKAMQNLYTLKYEKNVKLTRDYNMEDNLEDMINEYKFHKDLANKSIGMKIMNNYLVGGCKLIEIANDTFNPFDFKLSGWSDSLQSDPDEYYDVVEKLYEKYMTGEKELAPEFKLLLILGFSAVKHGMTNKFLNPTNLEEDLDNNEETRMLLRKNYEREKIEKESNIFDKKKEKEIEEFKQKNDDINKLDNQFQQHLKNLQMKSKLINDDLKEKERKRDELINLINTQKSEITSNDNQEIKSKPHVEFIHKQPRYQYYKNISKNNVTNNDISNINNILNNAQDNIMDNSNSSNIDMDKLISVEDALAADTNSNISSNSSDSRRKNRKPAIIIT